jgi:hypothetical protein
MGLLPAFAYCFAQAIDIIKQVGADEKQIDVNRCSREIDHQIIKF